MTRCQALPTAVEWSGKEAVSPGGRWGVGCLLASPLDVWFSLTNPTEKGWLHLPQRASVESKDGGCERVWTDAEC